MSKFTTISPTGVSDKKELCWKRFRDGGYVAIGWLYDTNLTGKSIIEIQDLIRNATYDDSDKRDALRSFPRFLELTPGDFVAVKNVNHGLFGIGIIRSDYKFESRKHFTGRKDFFYSHYRDVEWINVTYIRRKSIAFQDEKSWVPYGTVGPVYPELPRYIVALIDGSYAMGAVKSGEILTTLAEDISAIEKSGHDATTKEALVKARIGQGDFRKRVLQYWDSCCAVTRSTTHDAIRASHIKPWRASTDAERLDSLNGLPLVASLDALFDAGLISFEQSGKMIISSQLNDAEWRLFGLEGARLAKKPAVATADYLAHHRENCFEK